MVSHQKAIFLLIPRSLLRGVFIQDETVSPLAVCLLQEYPCAEGFLAFPLDTGLEAHRAKKGKKHPPAPENMPLIPPHAAGIAGGAEAPWVGVPAARDAQPVQTLSALTGDLPRLAAW